MLGALDGLLVIALEQAVAAPFCTSRLADAGARVIKIERLEGDFAREYDHVVHGESAYFVWLNRGKESISLDIKQPGDARLLNAMISKADIFIQNLAPGAAARAGFDSEELRARYPHLITCDISGYGEEGPWAEMKAYDFLIQCESGLVSITGSPGEPSRVGVSVADISCGLNAHAAILQALYERERSGRGQGVAISLFDCLADWMTVPLLHYEYGGRAPTRAGLHHPSIAPYGAYYTGDSRQVALAIQNEREWKAFCKIVLNTETLAADSRFASNVLRCANRAALDREIEGVLCGLTQPDVIERLRNANIAFGAVNEVSDLSVHPQLRRVDIGSPTGTVCMPASPWRWREASAVPTSSSPALNEHGAALRREFIQ
jgi:crotonobetainyl-CoA:carnitine CoA-transferase CaiB-like acyl-CoA transferase